MKKYLLLRNNQETGPHTIEQLGSTGLLPLDLVWIENESTAWKYPDEIEELRPYIKDDISMNAASKSFTKSEKIFVSFPSNFNQENKTEEVNFSSFPLADGNEDFKIIPIKPIEEFKENYRTSSQKKPIWNKRFFPSYNAANVAAVFVGAVVAAFLIKNMVDGYVPMTSNETSVALPIIDRETEKEPSESIKNALVTEIVPVYKAVSAKKAKAVNIKKQLKLQTNDYKVGLFGGINGLQLTVFNTSLQVVDKVIVALDYLRPNGAVVQSENVLFSSIKPKGAQTIAIPGSSRGVKLRYKIIKVFAHDYKADLKEI